MSVKLKIEQLADKIKDFDWNKILDVEVAAPALGIVAGVAIAITLVSTSVPAQEVSVNGKRIAVVEDKKIVGKALEQLIMEKTEGKQNHVEFTGKITYKPVTVSKYTLSSESRMTGLLLDTKQFTTGGAGIKVGKETLVVLPNKAYAQQALEQLKQVYVKQLTDAKVISAEFEQEVLIDNMTTRAAEVHSVEEAVKILQAGKGRKVVHTIAEGDSLWVIARKNDMRVKEIMAMNPQLKSEEDLDIGQEVYLSKTEPLITVKIVAEVKKHEDVPYSVKVVVDKKLSKGKKKVVKTGKNGERDVVYQLVLVNGQEVGKKELQVNVISKPQQQIIAQGARKIAIVASRGGGGDADISWPLRGAITSGFGQRWGRTHTGIDIDGTTGEPVGSAGPGRVIMSGWYGAYGKCVQVKHDNGVVTLYGHLSSISVSEGERVERGELIGRVGNTGRSYGSHLHFEVITGGAKRNPLKYLP